MHKTVRTVARFAIIAALVVTAFLIDTAISQLGLPIKIAVVAIVMVMTISQQFDFKTALFTGTAFGLTSFIVNLTIPSLATSAFADRPWVLICIYLLPRVFIGIACYGVTAGIKRLTRDKTSVFAREILPRSIGAAAGVLTNTVLVLSMIAVFSGQSALEKVLAFVVSVNFLIEFGCGLALVPAISYGISRPLKRARI